MSYGENDLMYTNSFLSCVSAADWITSLVRTACNSCAGSHTRAAPSYAPSTSRVPACSSCSTTCTCCPRATACTRAPPTSWCHSCPPSGCTVRSRTTRPTSWSRRPTVRSRTTSPSWPRPRPTGNCCCIRRVATRTIIITWTRRRPTVSELLHAPGSAAETVECSTRETVDGHTE